MLMKNKGKKKITWQSGRGNNLSTLLLATVPDIFLFVHDCLNVWWQNVGTFQPLLVRLILSREERGS